MRVVCFVVVVEIFVKIKNRMMIGSSALVFECVCLCRWPHCPVFCHREEDVRCVEEWPYSRGGTYTHSDTHTRFFDRVERGERKERYWTSGQNERKKKEKKKRTVALSLNFLFVVSDQSAALMRAITDRVLLYYIHQCTRRGRKGALSSVRSRGGPGSQ